MRFASIDITNYRQYQSMTIEFSYGEHDLHVLIGDNGTGKTNLLNAFTWCLYGKEPHLGLEDKRRGEPKLNKNAITEALAKGSGSASIRVSIMLDMDDETDSITRTLPVLVKSKTDIFEKTASESFVIQRMPASGRGEVLKDEKARDYLNRLLPEGIREYFFFDGEQLGNYFSSNRSERIKAAIYSISQIDVVQRMKDRTATSVKNMRRGLGKTSPNIQEFNDRIDKNEETIKKYHLSNIKLKQQIADANELIGQLTESLRGVPDIEALENDRDRLRAQKADCEAAVASAREAYVLFARNAFIDFAFYGEASAALKTIERMQNENQLPPSIDKGYLEQMITDGVCKVCGRPLSEHDIAHLIELLQQFRVSSETSHYLIGMRSELVRLVERVRTYPKQKKTVVNALKSLQRQYAQIESELATVEESIAQYPDSEKVKRWYSQRAELEANVTAYTKRIGSNERTIQLAERQRDKARDELESIIKRQQKDRELADAIDFGSRAEAILDAVVREVIDEVRETMSARTESLFRGLVWKGSKCERIELSDGYQLSLFDRAGYSCAGTCSAAERALLALSFTLAMHEVSGFESPLFIDTPIARASGENRANFADTLAEVSKTKQLILTFTPDEYSEAIASVFDPIAASNMRLSLDDNEQVVNVRSFH